ncbi:HK97 family phage prohead protease [Paracraurococcus ruber]|uniref:Prohead serine protease domain-containing protein n=1 Tax=Paracraurococcus ruber TaxID=77675 RepID=A0ABS1CRE5_9PROT|nr:HK97 family phage prohead protease [Paracraurococcus ruber]MBK1656851.1 hypothetical protein [Paracraurococcus ruber]TDG33966.1 HK97 family phage prohead protease [Paracraurococcus ruber]
MPDCFVPWTVQLAAGEGSAMTFSGIAAVYGRPDDGRDYTFAPGAFDGAVRQMRAGKRPAMLLQHGGWDFTADDMLPIGLWTDLQADEQGLKVSGKLADTARGRDIYALLKMDPVPAIDGLSIGFRATKRQVNDAAAPGEPRVTIQEIDLVEISVVTFPAMTAARVTSVQSGLSVRDLERRLVRDAGLSRREAQALLRRGKAGLEALRDAGEAGDQGDDPSPDALAALAAQIERNIRTMKG